jgi:glycosidase
MNTPTDAQWIERQAQVSLKRILPRLEERFAAFIQQNTSAWADYRRRLAGEFPRLFSLLYQLYGSRYDFFYHLEDLCTRLTQSWSERPAELKALDAARQADPSWFQSHQMLGGVCYVDLFAGTLHGLREKIPYFKELGLTYLHLMPLFKAPEAENDGGYAVSDYRQIDPRLGDIQELAALAGDLRAEGISLVVDLVFNHTSNEHPWALSAQAGDPEAQEIYRLYPDRQIPDAYEKTLREIFPDEHPGAFTYHPGMGRWVWTTFHAYQWDLNYANPAVFNNMAGEMLFLANLGVEALRLDAVAFIWKEIGTHCENLPGAHRLIQAFNAAARIAAPALLFKSEAIVHPDEVIKYIHAGECQLSYNPLLMALLWNSLATRETRLLARCLRERNRLPPGCAWVNYVRCHDDIGWTFSDEDAAEMNIRGEDHRRFLNAFYTGRFSGSFARGLPFQENPTTGDARISGTLASLAGLEKALKEETDAEVELAIRRILLVHAIILTASGVPLLYLGDELGTLNDYSFRSQPAKAKDSRWVHRPAMDWTRAARRLDPASMEGKIFTRLQALIRLRKENPAFGGDDLQVVDCGNEHVLGYICQGGSQRVLILANFSEQSQVVEANWLRLHGLGYSFVNLVNGEEIPFQDVELEAYEFLCLQ